MSTPRKETLVALHPQQPRAGNPNTYPHDVGQPIGPAHQRQSSAFNPVQKPLSSLLITATGFYIGLVVVLVYLASGWLYNWAYDRILSSSALPLAQELNQSQGNPDQGLGTLANVNDAVVAAGEESDAIDGIALAANIAPINVLIMGTDARPEDTEPARTDTMMLLSLNPQTHSLGILSLPRDLWVPIAHQGYDSKINMAYVIGEDRNYPGGGAQLAIDTVSAFVGQPVDYYVRLNFGGFVELVDLIGGIDITIPQVIHDESYPTEDFGVETFHLDAGPQHLNGEVALKYVRTRNIDDDYGRARRQQQVIRGIADKVLSADMIPTLLPKLPTLFYTMRSSIDTNIPMARQLELAQFARHASVDNIRQLVLDKRYGEETYTEEGAWILLPNREITRVALKRFFTPPQTVDGEAVASTEASWVRVEVLNGTGQPRVASRTRDILEAKGWHVISIDDADRSDYQHTLIINYGVSQNVISQLGSDMELSAVPSSLSLDSLNTSGTALVDLRIVVGQDYLDRLSVR